MSIFLHLQLCVGIRRFFVIVVIAFVVADAVKMHTDPSTVVSFDEHLAFSTVCVFVCA